MISSTISNNSFSGNYWEQVSREDRKSWFAQFCNFHHLNYLINIEDQEAGTDMLSDEDKNMSKEDAKTIAEAYLLENL